MRRKQNSKNISNFLDIIGASENNLKNLNLKIPKNKLVILTGVSGSGKSSLAFDTIYAEGQRRYVESYLIRKTVSGINAKTKSWTYRWIISRNSN